MWLLTSCQSYPFILEFLHSLYCSAVTHRPPRLKSWWWDRLSSCWSHCCFSFLRMESREKGKHNIYWSSAEWNWIKSAHSWALLNLLHCWVPEEKGSKDCVFRNEQWGITRLTFYRLTLLNGQWWCLFNMFFCVLTCNGARFFLWSARKMHKIRHEPLCELCAGKISWRVI